MLIPTKHERLRNNTLVLGAAIVKTLKEGDHNIEELYQKIKLAFKEISLEAYFDCIVFLWLCQFIEVEDNNVTIKTNNRNTK